jgi:hypothetical protein
MYCANENIKELRDRVDWLSNMEEIQKLVDEMNELSTYPKYYAIPNSSSIHERYGESMSLDKARSHRDTLKAIKYDEMKNHKCPDISTIGLPVNPGATTKIGRCTVKNNSDKTVYIGEANK